MDIKYFSLPVEFIESETDTFDDSLIPVDIKVMHDGLNLNNSTIFMKAIEDAEESLKNKPILGYVKKIDGSDDSDFSGHEIEISITDNGVKIIALQRPLGVIPENNSYAVIEEDGRNYVTCKGYLWKDYMNEAYKVLKDNPKKSVSMEIAVDGFEVNDDGSINITKYRYLGISILGDDLLPGMKDAELNVVGQFSKNSNGEFCNKIKELNKKIAKHFSADGLDITAKGGEIMGDKNKDASKDVKDNFIKTFELSHGDVRCKLYELLIPVEETNNALYWICEVYDDYFIYAGDGRYFKQNYIKTDVDVAFENERIEVFTEYVTAEERAELNKMRESYDSLVEENKVLKTFKEQREKEEFEAEQERIKQEKIDYINKEYDNVPEDIKEMFINKVDEYESIEDLDADICVFIVKNKVVFSKAKKKESKVKLGLEKEDSTVKVSPYGNLF